MKDYSFKIKVADLLAQPGSHDTIVFDHKFSTLLSTLTDNGIHVVVELKHLNKQELLVKLYDGQASFLGSCDRCGKDITFEVQYTNIVLEAKVDETSDEEMISIDSKDMLLDVEKAIVDQFLLSFPVKNLCKDCQKETEDTLQETDVYEQRIKRS